MLSHARSVVRRIGNSPLGKGVENLFSFGLSTATCQATELECGRRMVDATTVLDAAQIQALIPHRYPFLLVDRIVELEPGKRAVGLKLVSMSDG